MRINPTNTYQIPIRSSVWTAADVAVSYGSTLEIGGSNDNAQGLAVGSAMIHVAAAVVGYNNGITRTGMNVRRAGHLLAALGDVAAAAGMGMASIPITLAGNVMIMAVNACADSKTFE